mmetsp:Transcript_8233/g.6135  ORF Transcript_8233/g.6135 Transcript_8233/m.6135 type:complete len:129 (+) Transcript_8233:21-407(+)
MLLSYYLSLISLHRHCLEKSISISFERFSQSAPKRFFFREILLSSLNLPRSYGVFSTVPLFDFIRLYFTFAMSFALCWILKAIEFIFCLFEGFEFSGNRVMLVLIIVFSCLGLFVLYYFEGILKRLLL